MKKIMLATDFSERSDRAFRRATLLARQFDASLTIVHAVDDDRPRRIVDAARDEAEKLLRQIAATLREVDRIACETRVIPAAAFMGIAQAVRDAKPDLLVIGSHRRQVLRDVFIGTTAERTIRTVDCPVLMVNATPAGNYRHILQTTDLSDCSRSALQRLPALGIGARTRNSMLHVFDAPALRLAFSHSMPKDQQESYLAEERKGASRDLSGFLESAKLGNCDPIVRYDKQEAPQEILNVAREEEADLIVLSTHGRSGLGKFLIGSVTEQVLRTSPVDVLAIPPLPRR